MSRARALLAVLITAAALYVTRGVLDEVLDGTRGVRVALLPPWESLAGFAALAGVGVLLLHQLNRRAAAPNRPPLGALAMPALGLAVLLLPFTPILPDELPMLQMLAGPARAIVWLVVSALVVWVLWQHTLISTKWASELTPGRAAVVIAIATALVSGAAASKLTRTVLFPAGDEPHYLVMAQSLISDGDLKIENNHQRGDYREYFPQDLEPHYLTRGKDAEIYSIHPVGLPILLAPVYRAGGYDAVVWAMILMASLAAALAWQWVNATLRSPGAATFGWAAVALSAPFLFNSFTVYPEIAAALAVMVAITSRHPLVIGLACGLLPWLSTKYAPMSLILLLVTGTVPVTPIGAAVSAFVKRAIPYGVLLLLWFVFFYWIWGSPRPQAPYGGLVQTSPWNLVFGAPGLLFDQEYGLVPYAPVYLLAATGLWALWRAGGERRRAAILVVLAFGALLGTVGAFRIWWGGSASPGRPLASGLLLLSMPIAAAFAAAPHGSARRAAQHLLLWTGVGIAAIMSTAQNGFLIANGRDGTSSLLEWLSPRWELWSAAPSFIHHEPLTAGAHVLAWLAIAALAFWLVSRVSFSRPGAAALAALGVAASAWLAGTLIVPMLPAEPPQPRINLAARGRLAALDRFDSRALPAGLVFDPLRKTSAAETLPLLSLGVGPGVRTSPQPLRVLHNGRFSIPAGTYRVDVVFDGPGGAPLPIGLQVGRTGPPLDTWSIDPAVGTWSADIVLAVDAGFVGFRGPAEMERAIRSLTLTPVAVVDAGDRPRVPEVLAAGRYDVATVFFHDDATSPEPTGFWVMAGRAHQVTIAPAPGINGVGIRMRSGVPGNRVRLQTRSWVHEVELAADEPREIALPAPGHGVIAIVIEASEGFVPAERDPTVHDRRQLGAWVELFSIESGAVLEREMSVEATLQGRLKDQP